MEILPKQADPIAYPSIRSKGLIVLDFSPKLAPAII